MGGLRQLGESPSTDLPPPVARGVASHDSLLSLICVHVSLSLSVWVHTKQNTDVAISTFVPQRPILKSGSCARSSNTWLPAGLPAVSILAMVLESRHLDPTQKQDWILKCPQGRRTHPLAVRGVATLCSPPALLETETQPWSYEQGCTFSRTPLLYLDCPHVACPAKKNTVVRAASAARRGAPRSTPTAEPPT